MASKQIGVNVNGKDSTKSAFNSVSNNIKQLGSEIKTAASKLDMSAGFNKLTTQAKTAVSKIKEYFSGLSGVITSIFSGISLKGLVDAGVASEKKWTNIAANVGMTIDQMGAYKKEIAALHEKNITSAVNEKTAQLSVSLENLKLENAKLNSELSTNKFNYSIIVILVIIAIISGFVIAKLI